MGIQIEFNPDLALRGMSEFRAGRRKLEECIPEPLVEGREYWFLKKGQRNYWLHGEFPLIETKGDGDLSAPKASIVMLDATHVLEDGDVWTKGHYRVVRVLRDGEVYFNGFGTIVHPCHYEEPRDEAISENADLVNIKTGIASANGLAMTPVVKPLKFAEHLVPLVLSGEKTSTWRLFDDKDLWVGDILSCIDRSTGKEFGLARVISVSEKELGDIADADIRQHGFSDRAAVYEAFRRFYGDRVSPSSVVKIIHFELLH